MQTFAGAHVTTGGDSRQWRSTDRQVPAAGLTQRTTQRRKVKPGISPAHRLSTQTHDGWATLRRIVTSVLECSSYLAGLGVDEGCLPTFMLAPLDQSGNGHCHALSQNATGQARLTLSRDALRPPPGAEGTPGHWVGIGTRRPGGVRASGSRGAGGHHLFQGPRTTREVEALRPHACSVVLSDFTYKIQVRRLGDGEF